MGQNERSFFFGGGGVDTSVTKRDIRFSYFVVVHKYQFTVFLQ